METFDWVSPVFSTISETLKSGWRETGNTVPQFQVAGSANVTLTNFVYSVTITGTAAVSDLNFGNIPQGAVSGMKYRDDNKNGAADAGEIGLAGWSISQAGAASATLTTVSGGTFSTTLDPGPHSATVRLMPASDPRATGCTAQLAALLVMDVDQD